MAKLHKEQLESTSSQYIEEYGFPTTCPVCHAPYYMSLDEVNEIIANDTVKIHCLNCNSHTNISAY